MSASTTQRQIPIPVIATISIVAYSVVVIEICLTRIFAWIFQHHFAFFAVSLALCGLGLGGYLAHQLVGRRNELTERGILFWCSFGVPLTTVLAIVFSLRIVIFHPQAYIAIGTLLIVPFLLSGMIFGLLFRRYASASGHLYAYDLFGAALAAATSVSLLNLWGPINTILFTSLLSSTVPFLLTLPHDSAGPVRSGNLRPNSRPRFSRLWTDQRIRWSAVLVLGCGAVGAVNLSADVLDLPLDQRSLSPIRNRIRAALTRKGQRPQDPQVAAVRTNKSLNWLFLTLALDKTARVVHKSWNAFARNDVVEQDLVPHVRAIWADGRSPAYMYEFDGSYEKASWKQELMQMLPYAPYRLRPIQSVLSVGSGAGLDVHFAKLGGAREIDALELNPAMKEIVDRFRDFGGGVYDQPGVSYHQSEGRSFIKQSKKPYDLIVLALTLNERFSRGTLSESYITTLEASRDYLTHLTEQGMVSFFTPHPRHALKWFLTCLEVMKRERNLSTSEALGHLAVIKGPLSLIPYDFLVLMSNTPFTGGELDQLKSFAWNAASRSYRGWTFIPRRAVPKEVEALHGGKGWPVTTDPETGETVDYRPATDNKPYFTHMSVDVPTPIVHLAVFALVVVVLFALLDRALSRRGAPPPYGFWTGYFSCLGIGFMLVEIGLIQGLMLVIGSPTHTVALLILSLLLGGAGGSRLSQRIKSGPRLILWALIASLATCAAMLVLGLSCPAISNFLLRLPLWERWVSLFLISAVPGVFMGMLFPIGLRLLASSHPQGVPYFWGLNGVMSVIGSILAAVGGRFIGFQGVLSIGGAVYLLAGFFLFMLRTKRTARC